MERNNIRKHINNKHDDQKGHVCQKMFATLIVVLQHVAIDHLQDEAHDEDRGQCESSQEFKQHLRS